MIMITDEEINSLILSYLKNEGYIHTSFAFQSEANIPELDLQYDLYGLIEKGLKTIFIEKHLEGKCNKWFKISEKHDCKKPEIKTDTYNLETVPGNHLVQFFNKKLISTYKSNMLVYENLNDGEMLKSKYVLNTNIKIDDDISSICVFDQYLGIGTYNGNYLVYDADLNICKKSNLNSGPIMVLKGFNEKLMMGIYDGKIYIQNMKYENFNEKENIENKIRQKSDNLKNNSELQMFNVHNGIIYDALWINDELVASCSSDKTVCLLNLKDFNRQWLEHSDELTNIGFNGNILASGGDGGDVKIWNIENKIKNPEENPDIKEATLQHLCDVLDMKFTDKELATVSSDGIFRLWDIEKLKSTDFKQNSPIQVLEYAKFNDFFITGSINSDIVFYDRRFGEICKYKGNSEIYQISISKEENMVCVSFIEGLPIIMDIRMIK